MQKCKKRDYQVSWYSKIARLFLACFITDTSTLLTIVTDDNNDARDGNS